MKKNITLIVWLVIASLSLNAQDISKQPSSNANSDEIKLTDFITKLEWTSLNEANNISATSYTQIMRPVSGAAMVYPIQDYTYDMISYQSILPGYKSAEAWMSEDVETTSTSVLGANAAISGGCHCDWIGFGCQTSACAASCELYCSTKHGHGHK
jgi:hypothetical protein